MAARDHDGDENFGDGAGEGPAPLVKAGGNAVSSSSGQDLLAHYLSEVRRYPLLSPEEEHQLAVSYQETGDPRAAEALVTANLRLVVKLAFQYHRQWSNVLDLIQEGNVGLVEALSRYDPYRGIRFSSYAQYWIRAMILRFLMDNFRMVRLGSTRSGRKLFFQLQKERERMVREGLSASTRQLAERLDVTEQEVIAVEQHLRAPAMSLDAPLSGDADGRALSDVLADDGGALDDSVAQRELGSRIRQHMDAFAQTLTDEREIAIWEQRLISHDPKPLSVLGKSFGVSKERIRQVEDRMRRRLKLFIQERMGDEIKDIELDVQVPEV